MKNILTPLKNLIRTEDYADQKECKFKSSPIENKIFMLK